MKFWKNWPYWVRGGIMANFAFFVITLMLGFFGGAMIHTPVYVIVLIPGMEVSKKITGHYELYGWNFYLVILLSILFYFIVGAFIGWLYGKIKNRRKMI